ncbi:biotin transporter BioY [Enterococcus sp. DIV1420a]|uniref:biotin transporter BioY n=1 Tax=Enterococcus TaxID=1350 RepID=UPI0036D57C1C
MKTKIKASKELSTDTMAKMALFLALTIVSGMVAIPVPALGIPVVLQNMIIMLAGGFLGKKYGVLTTGLFLSLVFIGLPLLSGGRGGAAIFLSPSGGFLVGYLFCSVIICLILEKLGTQSFWKIMLAYLIGGTLFIDFMGSFSLAYYSHVSWLTGLKMAAFFVPIDTVKAIIAAIIHQRLQKFTYLGVEK